MNFPKRWCYRARSHHPPFVRTFDPWGLHLGKALLISAVSTMAPACFALDLADLDGVNGFVINALATYGEAQPFRQSVSSAGDVNGDGISDLIVGAPLANPDGRTVAGESYVLFGSHAGFPATIDPSLLDGSNGFRIKGIAAGDESGWSVRGTGDVNGDSIDDLVIGSYIFDPYLPLNGQAYVVFGTRVGFPAALQLAALSGSNGFIITGIDRGDVCGHSASGAGDVNSDGIDDVLVGAFAAEPNGVNTAGEAYVVFGSKAGFSATFSPTTLNGSNGFVLNGIDVGDRTGYQVDTAGDFNGDGIADLLIAAAWGDPNGAVDAGEAYVVFGSALGFPASLGLSSLGGTNGFVLNGIDAGDQAGLSLAGAGDINGDGIADVVIGATYADPNAAVDAGEAYVVFGTRSALGPSLNLSTLDGTNGFKINGIAAGDRAGYAVNRAGDVNGDGFDDLAIGAPQADVGYQLDAGAVYVLFGADTGFPPTVDLSALDTDKGITFTGLDAYEQLGISVSAAGDLNGGGVDDLVIGSLGAGTETGKAYVVFGESLRDSGLPDEIGVWRPGTRRFLLDSNGSNTWDGSTGGDTLTAPFGLSTDLPVTGDWNGDGTDEIGVWRPSIRRFLLDSNASNTWDGTVGGDTLTAVFGLSTDLPVTGRW